MKPGLKNIRRRLEKAAELLAEANMLAGFNGFACGDKILAASVATLEAISATDEIVMADATKETSSEH